MPENVSRRLPVILVLAALLLGSGALTWSLWPKAASPPVKAPVPAVAPGTPPAAPPALARRTRDAIEKGLAWLARAQEGDGSWDLARWNPWHGKSGLHGFSEEDHWFSPAATGLAALAFLEAEVPGTPRPTVLTRALDTLVSWQLDDGRIGFDEHVVDAWFRDKLQLAGLGAPEGPGYKARTIHTYNHAVAAAALAVAARAGGEPRWKEAARRALAHLVADEHPEYRWTDYFDPESDIGVAAYVLQAARAGADAGLAEARPILESAPAFLDRVTDAEAGRTRMQSDYPACFDGDDSTAINAYCRRLLGQAPESMPLRALLATLCRPDPAWTPATLPASGGRDMFHTWLGAVVNHDAFTYGTKALAGVPGGRGAAWRAAVRELLLGNQVAQGEQSGSWEPIGVWDRVGGRIYATAMAVRTLADR